MRKPFVAEASEWRLGLLMFLSLVLFCGSGLFIVHSAGEKVGSSALPEVVGAYIVGIFATVFGLVCAINAAAQLLLTKPLMEIDEAGIIWRRWSEQRIPWDAIVSAVPIRMRGRWNFTLARFLSLALHRPHDFPSKRLFGRIAFLNRATGYGDIALSVHGTDRSFDELIEAFGKFAPDLINSRD